MPYPYTKNIQTPRNDMRDVWSTDMKLIYQGNALHIPLASESIQCIMTSPPYWNLRSYNTGENKHAELGSEPLHDCLGWATGESCQECYVCHMRQVFRELWRVLRRDGTIFLNLGDSYASSWASGRRNIIGNGSRDNRIDRRPGNLKDKDLCLIPERVALALQADGWWVRSDIIWHKPNPMPESVTDRPTRAHEYVFLLAKSQRYYWDQEAVKEVKAESTIGDSRNNNNGHRRDRDYPGSASNGGTNLGGPDGTRNIRTVWTITPANFKGAHFATYPPKLVERCILAGTSAKGACPKCGKPWVRVVKTEFIPQQGVSETALIRGGNGQKPMDDSSRLQGTSRGSTRTNTTGWRPACQCGIDTTIPCIVFDPFSGSGTTAMVAIEQGRRAIGGELSLDYIQQSKERTKELQITLL